MTKKNSPRNKEWEKERRDRLNKSFDNLAKLLPQYDPSSPFSKIEILQKSIVFIEELEKKNKDILAGNDKTILGQQEELQENIKILRNRNSQLADLLRQAGITIPNFKAQKYVAKLSEKQIEILQEENNANEINVKIERPKKYSNKITSKQVEDKVSKRVEKKCKKATTKKKTEKVQTKNLIEQKNGLNVNENTKFNEGTKKNEEVISGTITSESNKILVTSISQLPTVAKVVPSTTIINNLIPSNNVTITHASLTTPIMATGLFLSTGNVIQMPVIQPQPLLIVKNKNIRVKTDKLDNDKIENKSKNNRIIIRPRPSNVIKGKIIFGKVPIPALKRNVVKKLPKKKVTNRSNNNNIKAKKKIIIGSSEKSSKINKVKDKNLKRINPENTTNIASKISKIDLGETVVTKTDLIAIASTKTTVITESTNSPKSSISLQIDTNTTEPSTVEVSSKKVENSELPEIASTSTPLSHSDLSNDIFASLQVPSGGSNTGSLSPTAAFLMTFPVVSSAGGGKIPEMSMTDETIVENSSQISGNNTIRNNTKLEDNTDDGGHNSNALLENLTSFFAGKDDYPSLYDNNNSVGKIVDKSVDKTEHKTNDDGGKKITAIEKNDNPFEDNYNYNSKQMDSSNQFDSPVTREERKSVKNSYCDVSTPTIMPPMNQIRIRTDMGAGVNDKTISQPICSHSVSYPETSFSFDYSLPSSTAYNNTNKLNMMSTSTFPSYSNTTNSGMSLIPDILSNPNISIATSAPIISSAKPEFTFSLTKSSTTKTSTTSNSSTYKSGGLYNPYSLGTNISADKVSRSSNMANNYVSPSMELVPTESNISTLPLTGNISSSLYSNENDISKMMSQSSQSFTFSLSNTTSTFGKNTMSSCSNYNKPSNLNINFSSNDVTIPSSMDTNPFPNSIGSSYNSYNPFTFTNTLPTMPNNDSSFGNQKLNDCGINFSFCLTTSAPKANPIYTSTNTTYNTLNPFSIDATLQNNFRPSNQNYENQKKSSSNSLCDNMVDENLATNSYPSSKFHGVYNSNNSSIKQLGYQEKKVDASSNIGNSQQKIYSKKDCKVASHSSYLGDNIFTSGTTSNNNIKIDKPYPPQQHKTPTKSSIKATNSQQSSKYHVNWMTSPDFKQSSNEFPILPPPPLDFTPSVSSALPSTFTYPPPSLGGIDINRKSDVFFAHPPGEENFSWSPNKISNVIDSSHLSTSNFISSSLPTLHGDLALNVPAPTNTTTNLLPYSSHVTNVVEDKKTDKNYRNNQYPLPQSDINSYHQNNNVGSSNFLSVSQLVEQNRNYSTKVPHYNKTTTKNQGHSKAKNKHAKSDETRNRTKNQNQEKTQNYSYIQESANYSQNQPQFPESNKIVNQCSNIYSAESLIGYNKKDKSSSNYRTSDYHSSSMVPPPPPSLTTMSDQSSMSTNLFHGIDINNDLNYNSNMLFNPTNNFIPPPQSCMSLPTETMDYYSNDYSNKPIKSQQNMYYFNKSQNLLDYQPPVFPPAVVTSSMTLTATPPIHQTDKKMNNYTTTNKFNSSQQIQQHHSRPALPPLPPPPIPIMTPTTLSTPARKSSTHKSDLLYSSLPTTTAISSHHNLPNISNYDLNPLIVSSSMAVNPTLSSSVGVPTTTSNYFSVPLGVNSPLLATTDDPFHLHHLNYSNTFKNLTSTVGGNYPSENNTIIPSITSSGTNTSNSLTNFNLSSICPEINDKVRHHNW